MVKKKRSRAILILTSLLLCLILLFGGLGLNTIRAFAEEVSNNSDVLYLSDSSRIKPDTTIKEANGKNYS
ncbi:MAG: hypothetical protein K2K38_04005, partial [Clostridia bacterium]|nr:hypothetical protein [Clostridia bacterium]